MVWMLAWMLPAALNFGSVYAFIPVIIILVLIAAATGLSRGWSMFSVFGITALAGLGGTKRGLSQKQYKPGYIKKTVTGAKVTPAVTKLGARLNKMKGTGTADAGGKMTGLRKWAGRGATFASFAVTGNIPGAAYSAHSHIMGPLLKEKVGPLLKEKAAPTIARLWKDKEGNAKPEAKISPAGKAVRGIARFSSKHLNAKTAGGAKKITGKIIGYSFTAGFALTGNLPAAAGMFLITKYGGKRKQEQSSPPPRENDTVNMSWSARVNRIAERREQIAENERKKVEGAMVDREKHPNAIRWTQDSWWKLNKVDWGSVANVYKGIYMQELLLGKEKSNPLRAKEKNKEK